jgi:hypothetical protein
MALLAGCGGDSDHATGSLATTLPPSTTATTASTTAAGASPSTSTTALRTTTCRTDQITAAASRGSGAGGHDAAIVVFTNNASTSCTMEGYPAAWLVDAGGTRFGPISIDEVTSAPTTVSLPPGGRATTTVWTDDPQVASPPCPTTTVAGIEVVPPGQSAGLMAHLAVTVCSAGSVVGTTPVTPGTAQSAF